GRSKQRRRRRPRSRPRAHPPLSRRKIAVLAECSAVHNADGAVRTSATGRYTEYNAVRVGCHSRGVLNADAAMISVRVAENASRAEVSPLAVMLALLTTFISHPRSRQ